MTTNTQLTQVTVLVRIGELAMEWHRADEAMKQARDVYYTAVKNFEQRFASGRRVKVDENDPTYRHRCSYTQDEFEDFEVAKKKAYRAKRKLLKACEAATGGVR